MVDRLNGMETAFVHLDVPVAPMHVGMCCIFDPSTVPGGYSFAAVRERIIERLELIPAFRRRLRFLPGSFHRPVWIDDHEFDVDRHVHRVTLPAHATLAELQELTARLIARPLDRRRPLWELHMVDGLADGTVAAVMKMHHATVDGISGAELAVNLLDLDPEPPAEPVQIAPWCPEPAPSSARLVADAVGDLIGQPVRAASTLVGAAAAAYRLGVRRLTRGVVPAPGLLAAPRTRYDGPLTERRRVGFTEVSLDDVKAVRHATDTTVNDVVLAICASALRDHLQHHDALPDRPLVAAVPVAVGAADRADARNRLSAMLVELATTVDEPVARLAAIAASAAAAKDRHDRLGRDTLGRLADLTPAALLAALGSVETMLNGRTPPLCNVMVSNFAGPAFPLYLAGAQMLTAYPLGPLPFGTGLNITVQSYLDKLWFGIVACPDTFPSPERLPARFAGALDELVERTGASTGHVVARR